MWGRAFVRLREVDVMMMMKRACVSACVSARVCECACECERACAWVCE